MNKKELLSLDNFTLDRAVKIQGTKFDRKRKLDPNNITRIKQLLDEGHSFNELGKRFAVQPNTIRYNVDPTYRQMRKLYAGAHTGNDNITPEDRVAYKRKLVQAGANVIVVR